MEQTQTNLETLFEIEQSLKWGTLRMALCRRSGEVGCWNHPKYHEIFF